MYGNDTEISGLDLHAVFAKAIMHRIQPTDRVKMLF